MPRVTFLPGQSSISVTVGTELLDAAREAGIEVISPCGGKGACGKCMVRVVSGDVESRSLGMLSAPLVADGYALACKTRVLEGDVIVEAPEPVGLKGGKISEEDETYLVRRELLPENWAFDPLALKWVVQVPPPALEDGLSDMDRLTRSLQREWGQREVISSLGVLRTCAGALREKAGLVTVSLAREDGKLHLIRIEAGDTSIRNFAVAIDLGTTTVSVQLIHLAQARILGVRSDYNDQVACGLDVISRINYAQSPVRLEELRVRAVNTINRLIRNICRAYEVEPEEVCNAVVSGNTTMIHLLLGLPPEYIRVHPYTPTVLAAPYLTASNVGIQINSDSSVYFSPNVGSYVGGDITAGLLCTDLAADSEAISLFMDIGTNGELVVGNRDFLVACACSAGPAFEGGGIACGMRAAIGAIESVAVDPDTAAPSCRTIGGTKPRGICGTGMIDLLANLFLTGWVDRSGRLDRSRPSPSIRVGDRQAVYVVAGADETVGGEEVIITEANIENLLRTKAAIYSACALMLQQLGVKFNDLTNIYVAGGFGRYLDIEKCVAIGLLPDVPRELFKFIGNASLMGSYMAVVSQEYRETQRALAKRMTYLELNADPCYMDQYMGALFLPHTDGSQFPTVRVNRQHCCSAAGHGRPGLSFP